MRITLKHTMLLIALSGLNLYAIVVTRDARREGPLRVSWGNGRGLHLVNPDGSEVFIPGNLEGNPTLNKRPHILVRPPDPLWMRAWSRSERWGSPLVASGAITLLVVLALIRRARSRRGLASPDVHEAESSGSAG